MIDIFVLDKGNVEWMHDIDYKRKDIKDILYPVKKLPFEDTYVYVPHDYKKYLELWLGSYPPKMLELKDRITHEGKVSFTIPKVWKKTMYQELY